MTNIGWSAIAVSLIEIFPYGRASLWWSVSYPVFTMENRQELACFSS